MARTKCSVRFGSFGLGGLSPIKQCNKPATVIESYTVEPFVSKIKEFSREGGTYSSAKCDRHRTVVTETTTKTFKVVEL